MIKIFVLIAFVYIGWNLLPTLHYIFTFFEELFNIGRFKKHYKSLSSREFQLAETTGNEAVVVEFEGPNPSFVITQVRDAIANGLPSADINQMLAAGLKREVKFVYNPRNNDILISEGKFRFLFTEDSSASFIGRGWQKKYCQWFKNNFIIDPTT